MNALQLAVMDRVRRWTPDEVDALLYGCSALFAGITIPLSGLGLYRQWGELAVGPYVVGALAMAVIAHHGRKVDAAATDSATREKARLPLHRARLGMVIFVLLGASIMPLALEVHWRSDYGGHTQPEVTTVEQAGQSLGHDRDPYRATVKNGKVVHERRGEPAYESFFPYLPFMAVFGLPSSTHAPVRLTDARIFFSTATLLVVAMALWISRGPTNHKLRALQVLTVLPTAALPLATGGDDMPVVACLLLAIVLAQRRRPFSAGLALGVAAGMKFTAWPLAVLGLLMARDRQGKRAPWHLLAGEILVAGPAVVPFVLRNPRAFVDNAILFPLGLVGVNSPAASNLPGHLLVKNFPQLHHVLPLVVAVLGAIILWRRLRKKIPQSVGETLRLAGWIMTVGILFAPATRVGYLLYPINFFVWAALAEAEDRLEVPAELPLIAPGPLSLGVYSSSDS